MKETYSSRIKFLGRNYNKDEYSMYARSMDCVASRFEFFHDIESSIIKNTELLRDDYDYYVDNVSEAGWAVSRKIASLLYSVCEFTSPMNILDLGSGFSTFVLAKYAKSLSHKINIYSYDCDDAWLKKTKSFLSKNGLLGFVSIKNYKKFKGGEFDLIFDDIEWANGVRKRDLESIVSTLSQTGILILDDIHWEVLEKKAKELDASNKCCFYDLKKYTLDGNKDRKAGLICDPDSNKLTSRFLFRNTIGKKRKTSSDIKKMKRAGVRW
jgi:predicted O-methyltransferase YrrM